MGTKNNPGAFDCYANAAPDEPMFVLLARDRHAAPLVWLWAVMRELDGEDASKVDEARDCAAAMVEWAAANERKVVGMSVPTLAGVFELIRAANLAVEKGHTNTATGVDLMRMFLGVTKFEGAEPATKESL